jgi:hypothetical protein
MRLLLSLQHGELPQYDNESKKDWEGREHVGSAKDAKRHEGRTKGG